MTIKRAVERQTARVFERTKQTQAPLQRQPTRMEEIEHEGLRWIDIQIPTSVEMNVLQQQFPFHPLDLEDCLSKVQRSKLDVYDEDEYLFLVLHFPIFDRVRRLANPGEVDIFVGRDYIVTVHDGRLKPLKQMFATCQMDDAICERNMSRGSGFLLYRILDRAVDYCFPIMGKITEHIEEIEQEIFDRDIRKLVQELAYVRRDIISLRRIIKPNLPVLRQFEARTFPFLQLDEEVYFGDVLDSANKQWDMLEDDKEIIEGLNDTLDTLTSHRINEVMKILTVISVVLLPMTLVASIYGMNIELPFASHPLSFFVVLGFMLASACIMLSYFRWKDWI
jgi:magnesium transporter